MRALIYTRVSTQEQVNEGISLDNQLEKIKAFCFAKDWEVIHHISDEGESGKSLNRPGMQNIITLAKNKQFDVIVVYKLDRLTRSVKDLGYLIEDVFNKQDIAFTSVTDNFDTSTANGKLILNILGSVAQWERDIIAERTKDALNYKKNNQKIYGNIPFGKKSDAEGNLIDNVYELNIIKEVKEYRSQGLSLAKIGQELEDKKYKNRRNIINWSKSVIAEIVKM